MKIINFILTLIVILSIVSCDEINNKPAEEGKISIIGALHTGEEKQFIQICKISDLSEKKKFDSLFLRDADVTLIGDDFEEPMIFTIQSQPYLRDIFYYENKTSLKARLIAGKTYRLRVRYDNKTVNGLTTIPGKFEITSHKNNDTITTNEKVRLSWSKSPGAYMYIVNYGSAITILYNGQEIGYPGVGYQIATQDTFLDISKFPYLKQEYVQYPILSQWGYATVIALDKNYYDHAYLKRDRAGLDAGYGCFSSGNVDTIKFIFKN